MDNAPSHNGQIVQSTIDKMGFVILDHVPNSPDMAPADLFIFPRLKHMPRCVHYDSVSELCAMVQAALRQFTEDDLFEVFEAWVKRHEKCIRCNGHYFEKDKYV